MCVMAVMSFKNGKSYIFKTLNYNEDRINPTKYLFLLLTFVVQKLSHHVLHLTTLSL